MRPHDISLEFLRRVSRRRRRSVQCGVESIAEYIERHAARLTPEQLGELRKDLPLLKLRFATIAVPRFPHLPAQLELLTDFLEDTQDVFPPCSEAARQETAFALRYTAKEVDIIPDSIHEIGYADDSLVVRTVLCRHEDVFRDYCRFRKIRWSNSFVSP